MVFESKWWASFKILPPLGWKCYKLGTQKGAERAVEAVDAVHAVRDFLSKFSAC
jgi:hypothetical protein